MAGGAACRVAAMCTICRDSLLGLRITIRADRCFSFFQRRRHHPTHPKARGTQPLPAFPKGQDFFPAHVPEETSCCHVLQSIEAGSTSGQGLGQPKPSPSNTDIPLWAREMHPGRVAQLSYRQLWRGLRRNPQTHNPLPLHSVSRHTLPGLGGTPMV